MQANTNNKRPNLRLVVPKDLDDDVRAEHKKQYPDRVVAFEELLKIQDDHPPSLDLETVTRFVRLAGGLYRHAETHEDFMRVVKIAEFVYPYITNAVINDEDTQTLGKKIAQTALERKTKIVMEQFKTAYEEARKKEPNLLESEFKLKAYNPDTHLEGLEFFTSLQHTKDTVCWYREEVYKLLLCCVDPIGQTDEKEALRISLRVAKDSINSYYFLDRYGNGFKTAPNDAQGQKVSSELIIHQKFAVAQATRYADSMIENADTDNRARLIGRLTRAAMVHAYVVQNTTPDSVIKRSARNSWTEHMDQLRPLIAEDSFLKIARHMLKRFTLPPRPTDTPQTSFALHILDKYPELKEPRSNTPQAQPVMPHTHAAPLRLAAGFSL